MSLTFNGTSDVIRLSVGTSTAFAVGTHTVVFCAKKRAAASDAVSMAVLGATTSFENVTVSEHLLYGPGGHNGQLCIYQDTPAPTTTYGATPTAMQAADGWEIAGLGKTGGTSTPRFHSYNFTSTTQSHENSIAGSVADSLIATGVGGVFTIGRDAGTTSDYFDGDIAWVALWDGTELADSDYVTMQPSLDAVASLNPTHLWVMTTTGLVDAMGHGATELSRSGTTAGSTPPTGHSALTAVVPSAPTINAGGYGWNNATYLSATPGADGFSPITAYQWDYALNSAPTTWLGPYGTTTTPPEVFLANAGILTLGTAYVFRVRAINAVGNGAWSATSSSITPADSMGYLALQNGTDKALQQDNFKIQLQSPATATGTSSVTLASVIQSASGSSVTGTSTRTLGSVTQSGSGSHGVSGTESTTLSSVTQASAGSSITGTIARTLNSVTQASAGSHGVAGAEASTLGNVTQTSAGSHGVAGTEATTLGSIVQAASGATVAGTSAVTISSIAQVASGAHGVSGTQASTLGSTTQSATGTFTQPSVSGTSSVTLGSVVHAATSSSVVGSSSVTLGSVVQAATGTFTVTGTQTSTLASVSQSSTGSHGVAGSSSGTLGSIGHSASGGSVVGSVAITLNGISSTGFGGAGSTGTSSTTLGSVVSSASGIHSINGTSTAVLDPVIQVARQSGDKVVANALYIGNLTVLRAFIGSVQVWP